MPSVDAASCVELTRSLSHPSSGSTTPKLSPSPSGNVGIGVSHHRNNSLTYCCNPTSEGGDDRVTHRRRNSLTGFRFSSTAERDDDRITHGRRNSLTGFRYSSTAKRDDDRITHRRRNSVTGFRHSSTAERDDDRITHRRRNSLTGFRYSSTAERDDDRITHRRRNSLTGFRYSSTAERGDDRTTHRRRNSLTGFSYSSTTEGSDVGTGFVHRRRNSITYFCLPDDPLLRLSVLKLDGSTYHVQVAKTARVAELKIAIEDLFRRPSDDKDESHDISWSHVWGHFCLSYDEFKLTDDKAYIQTFGIKDGDQLQFIRHLSFNQGSSTSERKWRGEKHRMIKVPDKADQRKASQGAAYSLVLDEDDDDLDGDHNKIEYCDKIDDCSKIDDYSKFDDYNKIGDTNFSIGQLFREMFSYSRVRTSWRTKA